MICTGQGSGGPPFCSGQKATPLLMRFLLLTGSPARYMAPPQLGETQIIAGPDWPDAQTLDGKWISLRTPVGEYDLATVLAKIPADQQPDAVVCLVDAGWRNMPRNLHAFPGAKTLLIFDSEQLVFPLAELFGYIDHESYERVEFLRGMDHLQQFLAEVAADCARPQSGASLAPFECDRPPLVRVS